MPAQSTLTATDIFRYILDHPNEQVIIKHNKYNQYVIELEDGLYMIPTKEALKYIKIMKSLDKYKNSRISNLNK